MRGMKKRRQDAAAAAAQAAAAQAAKATRKRTRAQRAAAPGSPSARSKPSDAKRTRRTSHQVSVDQATRDRRWQEYKAGHKLSTLEYSAAVKQSKVHYSLDDEEVDHLLKLEQYATSVSADAGSWCLLDGTEPRRGRRPSKARATSAQPPVPDVGSMSKAQRKALLQALEAYTAAHLSDDLCAFVPRAYELG